MGARKISNAEWYTHLKQLIPTHGKHPKTIAELSAAISNLDLKTGATKNESTAARVRRAIQKLEKQNPGCISKSYKEGEAAYSWSETAFLSVTDINQEELIALGVLKQYGTDLISHRVRRVLEPYFNRAKEQIVDRGVAVGFSEPKVAKTVDAWLSKIAVLPAVLPFQRPTVDAKVESNIHEALFNQSTLKLQLRRDQSRSEAAQSSRTVSPLGIIQQGVRTYLVALDHRSALVKTFLLHRISSATTSWEEYRVPNNWDLRKFLQKGIGAPVLPADLYGVPHAMKFWVHPDTQWVKETPFACGGEKIRITDNPDGSFCLEADVLLTEELVRWLLSMSYHIKVLKPDWLTQRIVTDIQKTIEMYQGKSCSL